MVDVPMFTHKETAEVLGVHETTVGKWREEGRFNTMPIGQGKVRPRHRYEKESVFRVKAEEEKKKAKVAGPKLGKGKVERMEAKVTIEVDLKTVFIQATLAAVIARDRSTNKSIGGVVVANAINIPTEKIQEAMSLFPSSQSPLGKAVMDYVDCSYGASYTFNWKGCMTEAVDNVKSIAEAREKSGVDPEEKAGGE